ncbi:MAG TPA: mechanosensitive ion channel [Deltaproteobacteria bacterium]|nr:mechanosensitive ion channel [Deltaproteobacteria bacterium]HPR55954.1 mechanosensitive ion channel [Deltaproteobacteria bacterium]HXK47828.1 mechanosensitive ion channel [Deltaproteobacteria bacterium]
MEELWFKVQEWVTFYGIKIIAALVIFIVGRWIARGVRGLTGRILTGRKVDPTIVSFVEHLVYIALLTFVVIAALAQLGIQTTSFIAVIGAAGLAIGLALQGSLANFAAGFLMIIFKPFKAGDYIDGGGASGIVEKIEVFTTTLKSLDNKVIIIPNAKMMGDNITNYSTKETRRVDLDFGVSYGDDIDKVRKCIQEVVSGESRILKDPEPAILVKELSDSSVVFQTRSWVKGSDYWGVYFDVIEAVKKRFDAQGISIPFPQRDVHVYEHGKG